VQVALSSLDTTYVPRVRADHCSVETVTSADALAGLETVWNDVVDRAGIAHPFLTHDWVRTWWESFGAGHRLRILVVRSEGRVIAIAPLMLETTRMYGMPVRRLRLLQNDHSPRADFIVAGQSQAAYAAIWSALFNQRDQWDVLQLSQLPEESKTVDIVSDLATAHGCTSGVWPSGASPYMRLTGTADEYYQRLTPKFRSNLRNRRSRLERIGAPKLEVVTGGPNLVSAIDDAIRLEESGWKRREGTAICCDAAIQRFYVALAERMAARGWLRLLFLAVNGKRIATSYSICDGRGLYLCKTGYDPDFEACSPFKVLTSLVVRYAFEQGLAEIDFLGDPEPWKLEWTQATRAHHWLFVFSDSTRAKLLYPLKFQLVPALKRSGIAQLVGR
jgi:CelD/BcsL family acetyltransferase involved in cellulose biosynthesis